MTLVEAKELKYGDVIHHVLYTNLDGTPQRWRVNGNVKTWKRDASRVEVPLKHGLYSYGHLNEGNLDKFEVGDGHG